MIISIIIIVAVMIVIASMYRDTHTHTTIQKMKPAIFKPLVDKKIDLFSCSYLTT